MEIIFFILWQIWKNLIQVNPLYWILSGFALWLFYEKNLQKLQMNGITICFCQTKTTRHREDLTLCTTSSWNYRPHGQYWHCRNRRIYWFYQCCTLWLLWWVWWVCRNNDEWLKTIWKCHMMPQVLLTCTYIFRAKSRNTVRLT